MSRMARVPSGSRWERGLRLSLPVTRGVGSPSRSAAKACANSWMVMVTTRATSQRRKTIGLENRVANIGLVYLTVIWCHQLISRGAILTNLTRGSIL